MFINTWNNFMILLITNEVHSVIDDALFQEQVNQKKNRASNTQVEKEFFLEEICPKLIPFPPKRRCSVKYPRLGKLTPGEILDPEISQHKPNISWKSEKGALYTLYMAGFTKGSKKNIPSSSTSKYSTLHTTKRQPGTVIDWRQWVVVNIPRTKIHEGNTLHEYHPPGLPDKRLTLDYFVFLIYQQKFPIDVHRMREVRRHLLPFITNTYDFALEYDLGHPIAGTYFVTRRTKLAYTTVKRNITPKSTTRNRVVEIKKNKYFFDFRGMP